MGELSCRCLQWTCDGAKVVVWYGLMMEDASTERPAVSVEGIQNDHQVIVTGEFKTQGVDLSLNDFWASKIGKAE